MNRSALTALATLLLLTACASQKPQSWSSTDPYLEYANTKLEGRVAWIQFLDEQGVTGATQVSVGSTEVRWHTPGGNQRAPTASVLRIGVEPKQRVGRELLTAAGLLVLSVAAHSNLPPLDFKQPPAEQASRPPTAIERFVAPLPGGVVWELQSRRPSLPLPPPPAAR